MAALTAQQCSLVYYNGAADKVCLYALRNVTTGDTFNMSSDLQVALQAVVLGVTVQGSEAASVSGSTVTIPAGLAAAAGWLLVWGVSA